MKLLRLFALILISISASAQTVDITSNLVICMPMNGNANDYSGNLNNGVISGATPTVNRLGTANSAYHFDGFNDVITVPPSVSINNIENNDELTISAWCKVNNWYQGWNIFAILEKYNSNTDYGWGFNLMSPNTNLPMNDFLFLANIVSQPTANVCNVSVVFGQWDFYAVTFSKSAQRCKGYKNGLLMYSNPTSTVELENTNADVYIGFSPAGPDEYSDGDIDDVRMYNRALTDLEIATLYSLTTECDLTAPPVSGFSVSSNQVCAGGTISFFDQSTNSPSSWQWQFPGAAVQSSTLANPVIMFPTIGVYSVILQASNALGAGNYAFQSVTVVANPSPTITANSPVCINSGLTLSASAAAGYTWSGPGGFSGSSQSVGIQSVTASSQGVYTVSSSNGNNCVASSTLMVVISPLPLVNILNITGSSSITCSSPTIDLQASVSNSVGALNHYWSSNSFTSSNGSILVTNPSSLITLVVTDLATGCVGSTTTSIGLDQVSPTSVVNPVNQNITCGIAAVVTATGSAISPTVNITHAWYSPGINVPVQGGGQSSIYSLGGPGTYTHVLINNINGCTTTKTIQVTSVVGFPAFNVVSPPPYNFTVGCSSKSVAVISIIDQDTRPLGGGTMTFAVLPPGYSQPTYSYSGVLSYSMTVPGNYTFIVQDVSNQCETRITVPVIQDIFQPNASVYAAIRTLTCKTPSVMLQGMSTNTAVSYNWTFQNGQNPNVVPGATIVSQTTTNTAMAGTVVNTYSLTVINTNNLCKTNSVVTIYQNIRPPRPIINGAAGLDCMTHEQTLVNGSLNDEAPGFFPPLGTAAIRWEGPSPQQTNTDTISNYIAKTVGIYTMTVMDRNNGCISQTTALVKDNRNYPTVLSNSFVILDCGASFTGVNLNATVVGLKPADVDAIWTVPFPTPNIRNANTLTLTTGGIGDYTLSVTTKSNGCKSEIRVTVGNGVLIGDFMPDVYEGFAPLTVNFANKSMSSSTVTGASNVISVWSFGNGATRTTSTNINTATVYNQAGTYTVTLFVHKGSCVDTVSKIIRVDIPSKLIVPNIFTPNGDNSNDVFFIKAANLVEISALIYDRWGNKVYELLTGKGNIAWDGTSMSGSESPDGTYFYIITAKGKDGQNYDVKGNVTLLR